MEWKEVQLCDTCDLIAGYAFKSKDFGDYPSKVLKIADINPPFVSSENSSGVDLSKYDLSKLDKYIVKKGDYILAMTGATIGKLGRYISGEQAYLNQRVLKFNPHKSIDSDFLYYVLCGRGFPKYVMNHIDSESAQPNISAGTIGKFVFQLPANIEDQRRIASILSSLDDKIAINRRICENLEAQAQALFKHWFIDFAPFKNGKFVESELGMIPEGWRVGTLGEICTTNKRTLSSKNIPDVIEYLDTGNITANKIDDIQILHKGQDKIPSRAKRLVSEGDVIFSSVRPNQRHYGLLMNPSPFLVVSTGFVVITASWSGYRYFIYGFLIQNSIIETLQAIGEQSVSTYPSINANDIESLKIIIPRMEDIEDFADICCNFYCKIESLVQESSRLSALRDTLLPKLMSGEIKV